MKVAIFTEVFLGKWLDFTQLSKNLIGGAEVYLYELSVGPLLTMFDQVKIYQTHGEGGQLKENITVETIPKLEPNLVADQQLLITNNGFSYPPTSKALIKVRLANRSLKIINLHHGSIVKPSLIKKSTFLYWKSVFYYLHPDKSHGIRLLLEVGLWEVRRWSIIARMNILTLFVDQVVSVDSFSLQYIMPFLRPRWKVILNAADITIFTPQPRPKHKKKIILIPRNLRYERGIPLMPEVASLVKQYTQTPFEFWITGTGQCKDMVEAWAKDFDVQGNILLLGHQDHFKDMPKLYKQSDIIMVPTFCDEGTSLSVIEAMASNRPVVTTDVGGINDIGVSGVHKLSSDFVASELAHNIALLLDDQELVEHLTQQALELVRAEHSLPGWADQWQEVLNGLVKDMK